MTVRSPGPERQAPAESLPAAVWATGPGLQPQSRDHTTRKGQEPVVLTTPFDIFINLYTSSIIRLKILMNFMKCCDHCEAVMPSSVLLSCQWALYSQQFFAMFMKRAMFSWRNWNLILLQILALLGIFYFLMSDVELSIGEDSACLYFCRC